MRSWSITPPHTATLISRHFIFSALLLFFCALCSVSTLDERQTNMYLCVCAMGTEVPPNSVSSRIVLASDCMDFRVGDVIAIIRIVKQTTSTETRAHALGQCICAWCIVVWKPVLTHVSQEEYQQLAGERREAHFRVHFMSFKRKHFRKSFSIYNMKHPSAINSVQRIFLAHATCTLTQNVKWLTWCALCLLRTISKIIENQTTTK